MKLLNTLKKRDIMRWILFTIAFSWIIYDIVNIENDYNKLYDIEKHEYKQQLVYVIDINKEVIEPSKQLQIDRDITFRIINISLMGVFLVLLYAGRIKKEDLKK